MEAFDRHDPDVVLTEGGDAHLLPALRQRAEAWGVHLRLGRSSSVLPTPTRRTTVRSYGRLLRRGGHHRLEGRVHIDLATSFLGREAGLPGLIELSQASGRPLDAVARRSPGAVISAIQVRTAMQDGVLIPWRKNRLRTPRRDGNCCMPIAVVCTSIQDRGFMWTCLSWILPASSQASSPRETSP